MNFDQSDHAAFDHNLAQRFAYFFGVLQPQGGITLLPANPAHPHQNIANPFVLVEVGCVDQFAGIEI